MLLSPLPPETDNTALIVAIVIAVVVIITIIIIIVIIVAVWKYRQSHRKKQDAWVIQYLYVLKQDLVYMYVVVPELHPLSILIESLHCV